MAGNTATQKVPARSAPVGSMGQKYLACGAQMSMRLWVEKEPAMDKPATQREYETVGFVIGGRAELTMDGQTIELEPGDSWVVPRDTLHSYSIPEAFNAIEVTSPPSQGDGRDEEPVVIEPEPH
jgi:mannose-6-phosphate isomerase-like protein (cupin superfamily)